VRKANFEILTLAKPESHEMASEGMKGTSLPNTIAHEPHLWNHSYIEAMVLFFTNFSANGLPPDLAMQNQSTPSTVEPKAPKTATLIGLIVMPAKAKITSFGIDETMEETIMAVSKPISP